ncbi:MAG: C_GCAxxG_C_C family protein [Ruminococcaceae bacterium]|nr:C_GCAxxG_C_C family protein [Oscillospiraceae bacterium]
MKDYGMIAKELFLAGYNCSQAVFCAFAEDLKMDRAMAAKLSASFGGGMGRLRLTCGCVSGAVMVLGLALGYDPEDGEKDAKAKHYEKVRELVSALEARNGSINCAELLAMKGVAAEKGGEPEARTEEYYKRRPCPEYVRIAAEETARLLERCDCI